MTPVKKLDLAEMRMDPAPPPYPEGGSPLPPLADMTPDPASPPRPIEITPPGQPLPPGVSVLVPLAVNVPFTVRTPETVRLRVPMLVPPAAVRTTLPPGAIVAFPYIVAEDTGAKGVGFEMMSQLLD